MKFVSRWSLSFPFFLVAFLISISEFHYVCLSRDFYRGKRKKIMRQPAKLFVFLWKGPMAANLNILHSRQGGNGAHFKTNTTTSLSMFFVVVCYYFVLSVRDCTLFFRALHLSNYSNDSVGKNVLCQFSLSAALKKV